MKNPAFYIFTVLSFISSLAFAQWSADPNNPGVVCNISGQQSSVRAFPDGNEGVYVFWLDGRSGANREVYGQHYDAAGYASWETNGRLIVSHPNVISSFTMARYDNGDIILGWLTQSATLNLPDTLLIQKLGTNGEKLWPSDLLAASVAEPEPYDIAYLNGFGFAPVNDMYALFLRAAYGFGFIGNRYSYFNSDGEMEGPVNGWPIGPQSSYGSSGFLATLDGSGDVILYYSTGNGMGAPLMVVRAGEGGTVTWGPVAATEGSTGLNYGFTGLIDESGAIFIWQGTGTNGSVDLFMRRITNGGTFGWGGGILGLCEVEGTQSNMTFRRNGDIYYGAWADARPGVNPGWYDIYMQKFDTTGTFHWAQNGMEVASFNTYDPIPRLALDAEENIVLAFQSNLTGYIGQKITPDGTLPWGPDAHLITNTTLMASQFDHTLVSSGDNTVAAWASSFGTASDIFITRVDEVLHASVPESGPDNLVLYPNPARNTVEVTLEKGVKTGSVNLYNANGQLIESKMISGNTFKYKVIFTVADLPAGMYFVNLTSEGNQTGKKLLIR
jgi:hypothetical protein